MLVETCESSIIRLLFWNKPSHDGHIAFKVDSNDLQMIDTYPYPLSLVSPL